MQFFTPDLYTRFNSDDDDVADQANEDSEDAIRAYRARLADIQVRLTDQAMQLRNLCLHDAELLSAAHVSNAWAGNGTAGQDAITLTLRLDDNVYNLVYSLSARISESPPITGHPFSPVCMLWMYDEVDLASEAGGAFVHRILWSDGRVVAIPFTSVIIMVAPLEPPTNIAEDRLMFAT